MSRKAGQLLWNRVHFSVPHDSGVIVSTGLRQVNNNYEAQSINEPPMGGIEPGPTAGLASRVQVIPMMPLENWIYIAHEEPYIDANGYVFVLFTNSSGQTVTLNALFWAPHTVVGPGDADTYNAQQR